MSDRGALAVDLGPGGVVHAAQEDVATGNKPPSSSVVSVWFGQGRGEEWGQADAYYYGVAASSDGKLAIARDVTKTQQVPPFLSEGVETLRSTSVPVLVPPEEPQGSGGLVPSAEEDSYQLLFTNDPEGKLAHVEQINVFVSGMSGEPHPIPAPQSQQVRVRGTDGQFFCGASTCFLSWQELGTNYTVGEFGAKEDAIAFADSLIPIEALAGSLWGEGQSEPTPTPELVVRDPDGNERVLESVKGFCECGFRPLDWNPGSDRLLVLASAEGSPTLREYRTDGSGEPATLVEGVAEAGGPRFILDAAYGQDGVVALLASDSEAPGSLWELDGDDIIATDVRAFDMEGSTLAYVDGAGDVIVRDLPTGQERTVGEGAIDVSVAPDVIRGTPIAAERPENERLSVLLVAAIVMGGLAALLAVGTLLLLARRRRQG